MLYAANRTLRHATRCARSFPSQALLGPVGGHSIDRLDRRFGGFGGAAMAAEFLLYLSAASWTMRPRNLAPTVRRPNRRWSIGWSAGATFRGLRRSIRPGSPLWIVASEYTIVPVDHVAYPNRVLRSAGLLDGRSEADGEHLDLAASRAWALVDHQFSHVFVADKADIPRVADLLRREPGIAQVLVGDELGLYGLDHPRSGEVVLVSTPNSWQAYYYWLDDAAAPAFARTVDIHRKPGYDPVELFFDPATRGIPLDATLVRARTAPRPATTHSAA